MKKSILFLSSLLLFSSPLFAQNCFLAKENNTVIKEIGDCKTRFAPESTFKVPLSLMGFDAGVFEDQTHPQWEFKDGYDYFVNVCKSTHDPKTWMRDSCVWYSQLLTQKLGNEKFKNYVEKFNYGNKDISGDKDKNNGLTHSWLSSSLLISPEEQVVFLQKLIDGKLPVSKKSSELTKEIMFKEELSGGWKLYGKTGTGPLHGWFVGWIEKNGRAITFASHIKDDQKQDTVASYRARNEAMLKLWTLINELENKA